MYYTYQGSPEEVSGKFMYLGLNRNIYTPKRPATSLRMSQRGSTFMYG